MSTLSTHVLDTTLGHPAAGVHITLYAPEGEAWRALGSGRTDNDGRLRTLLPPGEALAPGVYRIVFATGEYFRDSGQRGFYPEVSVMFEVQAGVPHYHVPLLLNPWGYSTYRGS